jgi:hypothetical protein
MSKLKVFLAFATTSGLTLALTSWQNLDKQSFAVSLWSVNLAGVVAALISSKIVARYIFFVLIFLNIIGVSHIAYVSVTNSDAPIVGLALVALIFNVNVWMAAMGASAAPNWESGTKYKPTENRSNWSRIDQGEDPTL